MNNSDCRTLFLFLHYEQEKITKIYKEIISQLPSFDIFVFSLHPEENEFANAEFYEDSEYPFFRDFVWYYCFRYDRRFSVMILDENQNLVYNREMFFESEEEFELREFLKYDFIN